MKNGKQYLNSAGGWEERVSRKTTKEKGGFYRAGFRGGESWPFHKMKSMDSTGEKHIVLCIHFQYPVPKIRQTVDLWWEWTHSQLPRPGKPHTSPAPGSPPTALCSASSNIPLFLSFCSNCPSLGILDSLVNQEVQKRELPTQASLLCTVPSLFSQGGK